MSTVDVVIGAALGAPLTAAGGMVVQRRLDRRKLQAAARAISWSLGEAREGVEGARAGEWWRLADAGNELAEDWEKYGDTLRAHLPGPAWRMVEDTVRGTIHVARDVRAGRVDRRGKPRQFLRRMDQFINGALDDLRPYMGRGQSTPRRPRRLLGRRSANADG
jgi:hypothetical protein